MKRFGGLVLALGVLAGCSGGGGGVPRQPGGPSTQSKASLNIKIPAPKKASGHSRSPKFIAPTTQGMSVTTTPSGKSPVVTIIDLSATSPLCTPNADGSRTCTAPVAAPPGSDTFVFKTYDQAPTGGTGGVGGTIPSGANLLGSATFTQTITSGTNNTLNVSIGGVVKTMFTVPVDAADDGGRPQQIDVGVSPYDADNNYIIAGTTDGYANGPITVSIAETNATGHSALTEFQAPATPMPSGGSSSVALSQTTQQVALNYDGAANTNNAGAPYYVTITAKTADSAASTTTYYTPIFFAPSALSSGVTYLEDPSVLLPELRFTNGGTGGETGTLTISEFTPSVVSSSPFFWNVVPEPPGSQGGNCGSVASIAPQPNPTLIPSTGTSSQVAFNFVQINNGGATTTCRYDFSNYLGASPPPAGATPGPGTVELEVTNNAGADAAPAFHRPGTKMRRVSSTSQTVGTGNIRPSLTTIAPRPAPQQQKGRHLGTNLAGYGKITHVVVIMQENRSFNYFFGGGSGQGGWYCGAGLTAPCPTVTPFVGATTATSGVGLTPANPGGPPPNPGTPVTYPVQTVPIEDGITPSHDYIDYKDDCNFVPGTYTCQMNGWNDQTYKLIRPAIPPNVPAATPPPLGYNFMVAPGNESAPYRAMAAAYTLADNFFESNGGSSFISHQYMVSGQSEMTLGNPPGFPWGCDSPQGSYEVQIEPNGSINPNGPFPCYDYPNIATLADHAGVSWRYYAPNIVSGGDGRSWSVMDAFRYVRYGPEWLTNVISPETNVLADIPPPTSTLANITYIVPALLNSDHPKSVANCGPFWVTDLVNTIGNSKFWPNTAIFIMWDDWGGQFDPVQPPRLDYEGLGNRLPLIVISPYAKKHNVTHVQYEVASTLKFIEETFNLGTLGQADARAGDLTDAFDFTQKPSTFTPFPKPGFPPFTIPPNPTCPNQPADFIKWGKQHKKGWPTSLAPDDD